MKRWIMVPAALLLLASALTTTGCAPIPYQGPYCPEPPVIVIYEPPIIICAPPAPQPPGRNAPLTKDQYSGNSRVKTPRPERGDHEPRIKGR